MPYIVADSKREQLWFDYLEVLRQSKVTNMWGAVPYLQAAFPGTFRGTKGRELATSTLAKWIKYHNDPDKR